MNKKGDYLINGLLIAILVISIVTAVISINKIESLKEAPRPFAGYGVSGYVNLTITQNLSINVIQANVTFGEGSVDVGQDGAVLNTSALGYWTTTTVPNWTNVTLYDPRPIEIRNEGNVNASVTIQSSENATEFVGGTGASFQFNASNSLANSCVQGETIADWTEFDETAQTFCTNLGATDGMDELYCGIMLWVPDNTVGFREAYVTFGATAVT